MTFHSLVPIFVLLPFWVSAQVLSPGDVAVLGVSANTFDCNGVSSGDEISFVCLKDLPPGTSIDLTDNGFERCFSQKWGETEGVIRFTRSGSTIPAGTIVTYRLTSINGFGSYQFVSPDANWSVSCLNVGFPPPTAVNLNAGGDQLFFLAGGTWANNGDNSGNDADYDGKVLFGFNSKTAWAADCSTNPTQNSNLPTELDPCFHMEPTAATDFAKYTGPLTPADRLEWVNRLRDRSNWSFFGSCSAYSAAAPDFAAGLRLPIEPTKIGITGGVNGVCLGDTAFLGLLLPPVGGPFDVSWTDGTNDFFAKNIQPGSPLPVAPVASAIFSITELGDANGCSIEGDLNVKFFLESYRHDTTLLFDTTCVVADLGVFFQKLKNRHGCDSTVIRRVAFDSFRCAVLGTVGATDVRCNSTAGGVLFLTFTQGAEPFDFQWIETTSGASGAGQFLKKNATDSLTNLPAGNYRITVTDANGVSAVFQKSITQPPPMVGKVEVLSDFNGFNVRCADATDGRAAVNVSGGRPGYRFVWGDGQTTQIANDLAPGQHRVEVRDSSGCLLELSIKLTAPPSISAEIEVSGEDCFGKNNGSVLLESSSGGVLPHAYSFENQAFGNETFWKDLVPDVYLLTVRDGNACEKTFAAIQPEGPIFQLELGPEQTIFSGDSLLFEVLSEEAIDSLIFEPSELAFSISATEAYLFPPFTTDFWVRARSVKGCFSEDSLRVVVKKQRSVFVPNVFSPNAQLIENQRVTVFTDRGVEQVLVFRIFDRFGEMVFEKENFTPNSPFDGWDGRVGSKNANPGVFTWMAVVRQTDGKEKLLTGDFLLMR